MRPAPEQDEEALVDVVPERERRLLGAYFTPAPIVQLALEQVAPYVPEGPLTIVDPACGAGAFLTAAAERFPRAKVIGLDVSAPALERCRERVPRAVLRQGDALRGELEALLPESRFELWIGNPPYNGTSPLLREPAAYRRVRALLGETLPPGTSLRDDFAFFLLVAAERLRTRPGALAFVTSATLLDAFLYAPLRRALLRSLELRQVFDFGPGAFRNTRVRTCLTVWTSPRPDGPVVSRYHASSFTLSVGAKRRSRRVSVPEGSEGRSDPQETTRTSDTLTVRLRSAALTVNGEGTEIHPTEPEFFLRPADPAAEALDRRWRECGEPLSTLVPISFPGLKTRFDELLADADPARLLARVDDFLHTPPERLSDFASRHALPPRTFDKLVALRRGLPDGLAADRARVRPFFRYAGARHRGTVPASAKAFCYLDRRLIPRGDHRLRGDYDPHLGAVKLLFNVRELPLSAALLEEEGCVHDHRHARFAPLFVPERLWREGLSLRLRAPLGAPVPNLSPRGRATAERLGGPAQLVGAIVRFINSAPVQLTWAPAFGASRELAVPIDELE